MRDRFFLLPRQTPVKSGSPVSLRSPVSGIPVRWHDYTTSRAAIGIMNRLQDPSWRLPSHNLLEDTHESVREHDPFQHANLLILTLLPASPVT